VLDKRLRRGLETGRGTNNKWVMVWNWDEHVRMIPPEVAEPLSIFGDKNRTLAGH
jgi:hypothetical protein